MKLYLLTQTVKTGSDTYGGIVVAAENRKKAKMIHPDILDWNGQKDIFDSWCSSEQVEVTYLGRAREHAKAGVILTSYNAE